HPLILAFLGTANVGEHQGIVSLYMRDGNLMDYLKSHPGSDKKKLILQVAEAVQYLHADEGLVHGDLKCANVLISDYGDALLEDFGLSTVAEKSQAAFSTVTGIRAMNTIQFAAPELLIGEGNAAVSKTRESDVYAFGMLVLEV
ncbi:kinase-like protein, partial [Auricularia subglabra TFB-10046 SS5]